MFKFFTRGKPSHKLVEAMHTAAKVGDLEQIKALLKENPKLVNAKDKKDLTPLHLAAINDRAEVARVLLEHGANPNAHATSAKSTPLHLAAMSGVAEVARVLLAEGAYVNAQTPEGFTALHLAAHCIEVAGAARFENVRIEAHTIAGRAEVARVLLEHGANPNIQIKPGNKIFSGSPLEYAIGFANQHKGDTQVIEVLLDKGAEVTESTRIMVMINHFEEVKELFRRHDER